MALRYNAFCASVKRGPNTFSRAEKNSAPSPGMFAFEYCAISRNSNCGSCGGATVLTAFRYSSSGRAEAEDESTPVLSVECGPGRVARKTASSRTADKYIGIFMEGSSLWPLRCIYIYLVTDIMRASRLLSLEILSRSYSSSPHLRVPSVTSALPAPSAVEPSPLVSCLSPSGQTIAPAGPFHAWREPSPVSAVTPVFASESCYPLQSRRSAAFD